MTTAIRKQVFLCTIGSLFEWYDFILFACLAPILAEIFFNGKSHFVALMATFAIFASGFIMRPLGAIFFGHLGDTLGRKKTLLITIFSMTVATTAMGLVPVGSTFSTYILVICRLIQGFATSGEYPGSLALLAEQKTQKHSSLVASMGIFGTGIGCFAGALVYALTLHWVGYENMLHWGWRIPFLLGAPLGILGYLLRKHIFESTQFETIKQRGLIKRAPMILLCKKHFKPLLTMLAISILCNTLVYINLLYFGSFALSTHKMTANQVMYLNLVVTFTYCAAILVFGFLADYLNKKIILTAGCVLFVLVLYPFFNIILNQDVFAQFIVQGFISILLGMILGPFASILADSFPTEVRFSGLSLTLNIAATFFGGTAPMLMNWLSQMTGSFTAPSFYLIFLAALACVAGVVTLLTENAQNTEPRPSGSVTYHELLPAKKESSAIAP